MPQAEDLLSDPATMRRAQWFAFVENIAPSIAIVVIVLILTTLGLPHLVDAVEALAGKRTDVNVEIAVSITIVLTGIGAEVIRRLRKKTKAQSAQLVRLRGLLTERDTQVATLQARVDDLERGSNP